MPRIETQQTPAGDWPAPSRLSSPEPPEHLTPPSEDETMAIDWDRPLKTVDGCNARLLSKDLGLDEGTAYVLAVANGIDESLATVWPDGCTTDSAREMYVRNAPPELHHVEADGRVWLVIDGKRVVGFYDDDDAQEVTRALRLLPLLPSTGATP